MPPLCTNSAAPSEEAVFELSTQCANVVVVADRLALSPTATAPPQAAEFEVIAQLEAVTVESPPAAMTPPNQAKFEVITQLEAVAEESCRKANAQPHLAEFEATYSRM